MSSLLKAKVFIFSNKTGVFWWGYPKEERTYGILMVNGVEQFNHFGFFPNVIALKFWNFNMTRFQFAQQLFQVPVIDNFELLNHNFLIDRNTKAKITKNYLDR
jgi:hypothetical protein